MLAALGPTAAAGQPSAPEEDPLTVYLVTAEPGDAVWERFGHNGLWIADARTGQDIFWEWGLFSFSQEGFIPRLARGTMLYAMGGRYLEDMLAVYARQDRTVWAQELALTADQERALDAFVRTNALPENRDYIYDYYTDNCSTRVRDALDRVLGGQLRRAFQGVETPHTWRWHTQRLLRPMPWAEAGVQIVLGNPGDRTISAWEEMFLPMRLRASLAEVRVEGPDGMPRPLVVREEQLRTSSRPPVSEAPPVRWPWGALIGVFGAGLVLAAGRWAAGSRGGRALLGLVTVGWTALAGLLGTVLVVAWLFTDHDHWRWNENVLLLNPLLLGAAVLALPSLAGSLPGPRVERLVRGSAWIALAGLVLKLLPGFDQVNLDVVFAVLPVHLALAWTLHRTGTAPNPGAGEPGIAGP